MALECIERILDLPPEILLVCLSHVDLDDIRSCLKAGNRLLSGIILGSVQIQFRFEQAHAAVHENIFRDPMPSTSERLQELRNREANWLNLTPISKTLVPFKFQPTGIYDLASDVYSVFDYSEDSGRTKIKYTSLKYAERAPGAEWGEIETGKPIVDSGTALSEHDLIAIATRTPTADNDGLVDLQIMLLKFSTGEPHPLAARPILQVHTVEAERGEPVMLIDVLGDTLAFCVLYLNENFEDTNALYVYDWKTGRELIPPVPVDNIGFAFLTRDTLVVPSCTDEWIKVIQIRNASDERRNPPRNLLSLPTLARGHLIISIQTSGKSHPHTGGARPSHAHFIRRADESVILLSCEIHGRTGGPAVEPNVSRETLVLSRPLLQALLSDPEVTLRSAFSEPIPWAKWGPRCARWLDCTRWATRYPLSSCGTRVVAVGADATPTIPVPIRVLDFNPMHVRCAPSALAEVSIRVVGPTNLEAEEDRYVSASFEERLSSEVPYVEITSKEVFAYGALLINNEDLIGVTFQEDGYVKALEFLHFG
ncbi:hypothetical protein FB45DRAFT_1063711 [Roridomyces roridus]|uniref:F-box domain-containing protein n=1 Tax=Roridomyces roridus TaxID=1738132 RepID=A0AAD7BCZ0_9AGAR|nr:hypothetical protein FB45DRAFT_1063711 [Roridomyces roridus]